MGETLAQLSDGFGLAERHLSDLFSPVVDIQQRSVGWAIASGDGRGGGGVWRERLAGVDMDFSFTFPQN